MIESSDDRNLVGMKHRMQKLYSLIGLGRNDVRFVGIFGMSGTGKTTIARAIYDMMSTKFEGSCFIHEIRDQTAKHGLVYLQQKLLSEILFIKDLKVNNAFDGKHKIKRRLCCKRVLIVLDDVDHKDQLESLAGNNDWFGTGSRIIITTKDKHLLISHKVDSLRLYKMSRLDEGESSQLFRQYAFKKHPPTKEFEKLETQVLRFADGLPLALKVFGSLLYDRDIAEWRSEIARLEEIPEDEILVKLKLSFLGLNKNAQKIFLDIACFFNGKKKTWIIRKLDAFNFHSVIGLNILRERCMITLSKGRVMMHQLIQQMGWYVVRQEALEDPKRYSRLWLPQDISQLLTGSEGTEKIEGITLNFLGETDVEVSSEAFTHMSKLRLLKLHNANVSKGPNFLPSELRWLDWHGYPSKCLPPSFQGEKIVGLKMQYSRVIQLWKGLKVLDNLKFINLSHSQRLIRTPDFIGIPNLERLILKHCTSLVEIHASVWFLKNLVFLNLEHCINLKRLPISIHLEKLETLILSGCSKLESFPEITGLMACLLDVYAEATSIRKLPSSIECFTCLRLLDLRNCKHLVSLPSSICRLKSLKSLILSGCSKIDNLPDELGQMECLVLLRCDDLAIHKLPPSISLLKNLTALSFNGCKLQAPPFPSLSGLSSLKRLYLSHCGLLDLGVPSDLGALVSLKILNLSRNKFVNIPSESISFLTRLKELCLVGCEKLENLPELPPNITDFFADECTTLKGNLDVLKKCSNLECISFSKCPQIFQDEQNINLVNAGWQNLIKRFRMVNCRRLGRICFPFILIPEWFTYRNFGPSISMNLPQDWYNNKSMGFAICVASKKIDTFHTSYLYWCNLTITYEIHLQFQITYRDGNIQSFYWFVDVFGTKHTAEFDLTCLLYIPIHAIRNESRYSPHDWCRFEFFGKQFMSCVGLGLRLVYEDDVKQCQCDEIQVLDDE